MLRMVLAELDLTMALCGYTEPDQIGPDAADTLARWDLWSAIYDQESAPLAIPGPQRSRREKTDGGEREHAEPV